MDWQRELRRIAAEEVQSTDAYELQGRIRYRVNLLLKSDPASDRVRGYLERAFAADPRFSPQTVEKPRRSRARKT